MSLDLILYSRTAQPLPSFFGEGWLILGVAGSPPANLAGKAIPERVYFLLQSEDGKAYIEEFQASPYPHFNKIDSDLLWEDLYEFFKAKGLIKVPLGGGFEASENFVSNFRKKRGG